jgi:antiviral helicase SKI2
MQKLDCEICTVDIDSYYDDINEVVKLNQKLIDMAVRHQQGSKLLSSGRVVVLRDNVSLFQR